MANSQVRASNGVHLEVTKSHRSTVRVPALKIPILGFLLPLFIVVVWQAVCSIWQVSVTLLPSPLDIAKSFADLAASGVLWSHLQISVLRAVLGFLLGGGIGLLVGVIVGLSRFVERSFDPTIQMIRTIPHLAITPLFILWFGLGETSKILLIALGAFFPLYINTVMGIRGVDSKLFDVAKILEFSKREQLIKLVIPAALPNILLGLRLSIGVSWLGLVVAELMGSSAGVGYMILDATQFSQTAIVFVGLVIFAVVGKLSDSFVRMLEKRLLKWRDSYQG